MTKIKIKEKQMSLFLKLKSFYWKKKEGKSLIC